MHKYILHFLLQTSNNVVLTSTEHHQGSSQATTREVDQNETGLLQSDDRIGHSPSWSALRSYSPYRSWYTLLTQVGLYWTPGVPEGSLVIALVRPLVRWSIGPLVQWSFFGVTNGGTPIFGAFLLFVHISASSHRKFLKFHIHYKLFF